MEWRTKQVGVIFVVSLEGALDAMAVVELEKFLVQKIEEGKTKLVLNLFDVSYMSSAGVRLLYSISQVAQNKQGLLCVCCASNAVAQVLDMAGADQVLPVCSSEQDAFAKF